MYDVHAFLCYGLLAMYHLTLYRHCARVVVYVGRCPARHYMDELMSLVGKKHWGDPFPGNKIFSHEVSLHDEKAVQNAYVMFEKKLDNCTKVLIVP